MTEPRAAQITGFPRAHYWTPWFETGLTPNDRRAPILRSAVASRLLAEPLRLATVFERTVQLVCKPVARSFRYGDTL